MWKLIAALVLAAGLVAAGYYWGSGNVIVEKGETVTVTKDRIITRIITRKPDGTVTEEVREEEHSSDQTQTTVSTKPAPENKANYRIGANYWASSPVDVLRPERAFDRIGMSASRRVIGNVWVDIEGRVFGKKQEVALGLSVAW